MTRARTLADMISDGVIGTTELADDVITPVKLDETGSYIVAGLTVDTDTLHVDSANNRVGFGTTSPARSVTIFEDDQPVFQITNNTSGTANTRGLIQYIANGTTDAVFDNQGSGSGGIFRFMQAGTERLRMATSAFVVNEGGNDYDFRVEGDTNTHALFVNADNNRVGIKSAAPVRALSVVSQNEDHLALGYSDASWFGLHRRNSDGALVLGGNGGADIVFSPTGGATFNEGSEDADFRIESNGQANFFVINANAETLSINTNLTSTQDVETGGPSAPMTIKNGLNVFRDLSASGSDRNIINIDSGGSWSATGNIGTTSNLRWSNGTSGTMGVIGLRYGGTQSGGNSEFVIKDMYQGGYGASGTIAVFGSGKYSKFMGSMTVNEDGLNQDFRVESDAYSHIMFVDASENRVSIGHNSTDGYGSGHVLSVAGGSTQFSNFGEDVTMMIRGGNYTDPNTASVLLSGGYGDNGYVKEWLLSSVASGGGGAIQNDLKFRYVAGGSATRYEALKLTHSGEVIVNEDGYATNDVRVESDNNAHMFMIDAGMNKAAFGTSPQTALGGLVHTGSLSVGAANHVGYSVYSNHEGNIPSNTTVSVMDFEGPAYARYMKVTVSGYLCRKEVYFAGYQSWDNQSGSTVGSTTIGTQIFAHGSNASAVTIYLEVLSTSGTSGNPKYRLKISTGGLSGQLYDTTSVVEFFNPPHYVTYQ